MTNTGLTIFISVVTAVIAGVVVLFIEYKTGFFLREQNAAQNPNSFRVKLFNFVHKSYSKFDDWLQKAYAWLPVILKILFDLVGIIILCFLALSITITIGIGLLSIPYLQTIIEFSDLSPLIQAMPVLIKDPAILMYGSIIFVFVLFSLSVSISQYNLRINELNQRIERINRLPGIKKLRDEYDEQLFERINMDWQTFLLDLENDKTLGYLFPSQREDIEMIQKELKKCIPLRVTDGILVLGCSDKKSYRRINSVFQRGLPLFMPELRRFEGIRCERLP